MSVRSPRRCTASARRVLGCATRVPIEMLERRQLLTGDFGFAHAIGGASADAGQAIVNDAAGNVYVTGTFRGTAGIDFDPGAGTANLSTTGNTGVFVAKYNASGGFVWVKGFRSSTAHLNASNGSSAIPGG